MINSIQSLSNIENSTYSNAVTSKLSSNISTSGFNDMFSTLISDMNSLPGEQDKNSSSDLMTPMLMMMFNKLFGSEDVANLQSSVPQGAPVNGILTQTSHSGHIALDFGVPVGTNVKTTLAGKVTYAGWNNEGYGNLVVVENGAYKTYYAHLSNIPVKVGQTVNEGDIIGLSGNTGNSTGPHLHYEIRKNGVAVNPASTINNLKID